MSWKRDKIVQIKTFKRKLGLKALRAQLHIKANPFSKQLLFMFPLMYLIILQTRQSKLVEKYFKTSNVHSYEKGSKLKSTF